MEETNEMQNASMEALPNTEEVNTTMTETTETETVAEQAAEPQAEEKPAEAPEQEEKEPEVDYSNLSREELVAAFKELLEQDVQKIKNRVTLLRTRFNALESERKAETPEPAPEPEPAETEAQTENNEKTEQPAEKPFRDEISEEFHRLQNRYRELRQKYLDNLEEQKKKNLQAKQALIEELRQLIDSEEEQVRSALDKFNNIQERWKGIGEVPRDQMNDLWQNYHFQIEQFFNKLKINRELRALDQKRNLEEKIKLCEAAEELIMETSVTKAFKGMQDLRARWKEVGPVPAEQNEEIWQRFCNAANQIDERRKEYYDQRKEELDNNLLAKQALIDKAAELTEKRPESTKEWNDTTSALDELLKVWKTIGPVPREVNEEIWT